jgi:hypothetical protein
VSIAERLVAKRQAKSLEPVPALRRAIVWNGPKLLTEVAENAQPTLAGWEDASKQRVGSAWRVAARGVVPVHGFFVPFVSFVSFVCFVL